MPALAGGMAGGNLSEMFTMFVHYSLGSLAPEITTVAPFNPLAWFFDPANLTRVKRIAARRFCRDQAETLAGLPRRIRLAAIDAASELAVTRVIDAPYARLGITDDEPARAVLSAIRYCQSSRWIQTTDGASRVDSRTTTPYTGSMSATGDDPARIAIAAETWWNVDPDDARESIIGAGDDAPDHHAPRVTVTGGRAYHRRRKMESETVQTERDGETVTRTVWRMATVASHHPTEYAGGSVVATVQTVAPAYAGHAAPPKPNPMREGAHCPLVWGRRDLVG